MRMAWVRMSLDTLPPVCLLVWSYGWRVGEEMKGKVQTSESSAFQDGEHVHAKFS